MKGKNIFKEVHENEQEIFWFDGCFGSGDGTLLPVGAGLLGPGIYWLNITEKVYNKWEGKYVTTHPKGGDGAVFVAIGGFSLLIALITGPLCAIPFSRAEKTASIYRKINKEKLFSALSRTGIGIGYDAQNKKQM